MIELKIFRNYAGKKFKKTNVKGIVQIAQLNS